MRLKGQTLSPVSDREKKKGLIARVGERLSIPEAPFNSRKRRRALSPPFDASKSPRLVPVHRELPAESSARALINELSKSASFVTHGSLDDPRDWPDFGHAIRKNEAISR